MEQRTGKLERRRQWKVSGKKSGVQSEADSGIKLATFWEGFPRALDEVCASFWHVPSLLLFYCSAKARLALLGLGSPLKLVVPVRR